MRALAVALLCVATAPAAQPLRVPTSAQRDAVLASGWEVAREELGTLLRKNYATGGFGRPGSTGSSGYRAWMDLWKWCDLATRVEKDELLRLARARMVIDPDSGEPGFVGVGLAIPATFRPLTDDEFAAFVDREDFLRKAADWLLPSGAVPKNTTLAAAVGDDALRKLAANPALSRVLFENMTSDDYAPGVVQILAEIQERYPRELADYPALAAAIALVYDKRPPAFWPHHQVDPELVPLDTLTPADRFAYWVAADKTGKLLTKLNELPFEHVKFVIDAPVDPSEFEWAVQNVRLSRTTFANAFSSIVYDHDRLESQTYDWPGGPYTLARINREGGICVDQAYFAMVAGKARGLPTLFFVGQGADGGHAWFGYLKAPDRWELDCGRYENQNYAVGEALDPQSWTPITDHELEFLTTGLKRSPTYSASMDDLLVAGWFENDGDLANAARAIDSAVITCPANPAGWDAKSAFLARTGATADTRRKHHEAALKQFTNQRDRRVLHQTALANLAEESGDTATAAAMQAQIIAQNKVRRSDLGVTAAAARVMKTLHHGPLDAAMKDYHKAVTDLGEKGGGNLFYDLVVPFVSQLAENGQTAKAREALILARNSLQPESDSVLDREFLRMDAEITRRQVTD